MTLPKLADGCHRWGWLINTVVTLLMLAYFVGQTQAHLADLKERFIQAEQTTQSALYRMEDRLDKVIESK